MVGSCRVCLNTSGVSALRRFSGPFPVPLILALNFGLDESGCTVWSDGAILARLRFVFWPGWLWLRGVFLQFLSKGV